MSFHQDGLSFRSEPRVIWRRNRGNSYRKQVDALRTGVCKDCGKIAQGRRHDMHHEGYDTNPLANLVELCKACHAKRHDNWVNERYIQRY